MIFKLLTEHHLECLSLKGGCRCSSESTLVKMPHCWKSHVAAHIHMIATFSDIEYPTMHNNACWCNIVIVWFVHLFGR